MKLKIENFERLAGLWDNERMIISEVTQWGDRYTFQICEVGSQDTKMVHLRREATVGERGDIAFEFLNKEYRTVGHTVTLGYIRDMKNMAHALGIQLGTVKPNGMI